MISAPVIEEGSKGLGVLAALLFFRKYFDDILDGIIFAGVITLGFATVENVLYYGERHQRRDENRRPRGLSIAVHAARHPVAVRTS